MDRFAAEQLPEVVGRRTASSRHYLRPDGRFQAIIGAHLNYRSGGEWKRREDFALREVAGEIVNDSDDVPIKLRGLRVQAPGGFFELEGLYLDDELLEAPRDVTPIVTADTVTFPDVFAGVDVEYLITPHRVKETVRIRRNPLLGRFVSGSELVVRFKTSGRQKFKGVYAHDAQRLVHVDERWKGARYELAIAMADLRRVVYPLDVDPTVSPIPSSDAYVNQGGGRTDDHQLYCGHNFYDDGKGTTTDTDKRAYLRFDLSAIASTVTDATINLYRLMENAAGNDSVRQVTAEVDPETGDALTVFANAAGTSLGTLPGGINAYKALSVTAYANTHKGGFCDFGLVGAETAGVTTESSFVSSEHSTVAQRPYLSVTYGGGGGTTYTQSLAVVAAAVASTSRKTKVTRAVTSSAIASLSRKARRSFAVVSASIASSSRSTRKPLTASSVAVAGVTKRTLRTVSVTAAAIASAAGALGARIYQVAVSASSSAIASVSRSTRHVASATSSAVVGVTKRTSRTVAALASVAVSAAGVRAGRIYELAVAAVSSASVSVSRSTRHAVSASASAIASASRSTRHAVSATSSAVVDVRRRTAKALSAAASVAVSAAGVRAGRIYELAVSAVSSASVSVSRSTRHAVSASASAIASASRLTSHGVAASAAVVVSVNRTVRRSLAVVAAAIADAHPARVYRIALAATSSAIVSVSRSTRRRLSATAGAVVSVNRLIRRSVVATGSAIVGVAGKLLGHFTARYELGTRSAAAAIARIRRRDTSPTIGIGSEDAGQLRARGDDADRLEIERTDEPGRLDVEGD